MEAAQQESERTEQPDLGGWVNALPAWIRAHERFQQARAVYRHGLQVIANLANPPAADGSLMGTWGGRRLVRAMGVAASTFWGLISEYERDGFLVLLRRGGPLGRRNVGNTYAIPGAPGALDDRAEQRQVRRITTDAEGCRRVQIIEPGAQPGLWTGVVRDPDSGSPAAGQRLSGCRTVPSPSPFPPYKAHGADKRRNGKGRAWVGHIERADLEDLDRLRAVFERAVRLGWCRDWEPDWRRCVATAVHARRVGRRPGALFATELRDGGQRLTLWDEDEAARWIRTEQARAEQGMVPRRRVIPEDARLAAAVSVGERRAGLRGAALWERCRSACGIGWDRARWTAALRAAGMEGWT